MFLNQEVIKGSRLVEVDLILFASPALFFYLSLSPWISWALANVIPLFIWFCT